ncbi:reverse transcriptase [Phytophthora palmivora]|uniref:Reverse transcriptase n=1 Tax=Phytophthora palmivora TaxID=4796 RepID=A0A2P4X523_9STRA|nr:reverse transcriptase [Phytophthora palmivora]
MARDRGIQDLVVVGARESSSNKSKRFNSVRLVHVKREFNQAADYLTSKTLAQGKSWMVEEDAGNEHLEVVSWIQEQLMKPYDEETKSNSEASRSNSNVVAMGFSGEVTLHGPECEPLPSAAQVLATFTRFNIRTREVESSPPMGPLEYQAERWRRIKVLQEGDQYLSDIIAFLKDDLERFSPKRLKTIAKVADLFALDVRGVLYRLARSTRGRPRDAGDELRVVVPELLRGDMLHYAHEAFHGGHQGIARAHEILHSDFYWPGMYADVERHVKECVDCASGKGRPPNPGPSPGNIEPSYPFEEVSMDFMTHFPKSARGNTSLLLFQDMLSRYVMCKPMSSTTAQEVAEVYEQVVFQRFESSSMI